MPLAGVFVGFEVRRKRPLELQGNSAAHDADAVDGVHKSFDVSAKNVAGSELDHGALIRHSTARLRVSTGPRRLRCAAVLRYAGTAAHLHSAF